MSQTKITLKDGKYVVVNFTVDEVMKVILGAPNQRFVAFTHENGQGAAVVRDEISTVESR